MTIGRSLRAVLATFCIAFAAAPAGAHSYRLGDIAVGHIWAPPTAPGATGGPVYAPLLNGGSTPARLADASTPAAREVRFVTEGETGRVSDIDLPPGKPVSLAPWRVHLWLAGLERPLEEGDSFPLILDFGDAGTLDVTVVVETAAGH